MVKHKILVVGALMCALALTLCQCHQQPYQTDNGMTWGTTYHITYQSDTNLRDSIEAQMRLIDSSLSPFVEDSQISRINQGDSLLVVDEHFIRVFDLSQKVCSLSNGAFDPTVAPLINLWGFGYRDIDSDRPSQTAIDSALTSVGLLQCAIDPNGQLIKKSPLTEFNFSAVAKGYGVDLVAEMLKRNGCDNFMVEIGGEISISGNSPRGDNWNIQIDAPSSGPTDHSRLSVIQLTDRCIATSGNYRNRRTTAEGEVWHTISPVSGYPVVSHTLSATIIAPTTALADALATAAMAMPAEEAINMLAEIPDVEGMIVIGKTDGSFDLLTTPSWPK